MTRKKGLGRGLGALLEGSSIQLENEKEAVYEIDINDISPQANQPRKIFDNDKLQELAVSIQEHGVLQPIILHKKGIKDYVIIAGERRWRASRIAGLKTVPAIIRELDDRSKLQHALIENIQREDLNALEEAAAYQQLIDEYEMTQEELAAQIGKSRSAIANTLRLNALSKEIKDLLNAGSLTEGHARALLALKDESVQLAAAHHIVKQNLNVRQSESYVNSLKEPKKVKQTTDRATEDWQYALSIRTVEDNISQLLGVRVSLKDRAGKGKIEIPYKNLDELDRLLQLLGVVDKNCTE